MSFASRLETFGNAPALVLEQGESVSYIELAQMADALFKADNAPAERRTLVAIECENKAASIAGYLGALRNHHPALLIDAALAPELKKHLYTHFQIPYVLSSEGIWLNTALPPPAVHPDLALLLSTSGSTGSSKLVRLSMPAVHANALSISQYLALTPQERPITTLPMHYSYGLSVLNSHFLVGAAILLTSQPVTARRFWDFFRNYDASSFAGVPMIYTMLRQLRFERMDLPSLKTMTQAGGRLAPALVSWFGDLARSRAQRFFVMYGQTEATARIAFVPPEKLLDKTESIGIPIPEGRLDLIDAEGKEIHEANVTGELRYSGPNVMMGYASSVTDLALSDTQYGVLLTGDLASKDTDGYFYLKGRLHRFIKIFGNRIGLDEVETHLREKGYDAAVTGRDDLLVIALQDNNANLEETAAFVATHYRLHHSAIRVIAVEHFPLSSAGKIQYAKLLEQFAL